MEHLLSAYHQYRPVPKALHILTHLAEVKEAMIIHKQGNQGQERLINLLNLPTVASRLSDSRVWALYHKPACSIRSQGMGPGQR